MRGVITDLAGLTEVSLSEWKKPDSPSKNGKIAELSGDPSRSSRDLRDTSRETCVTPGRPRGETSGDTSTGPLSGECDTSVTPLVTPLRVDL